MTTLSIPDRIRAIRERQRMSQVDFSRECKRYRTWAHNVESGIARISARDIITVCKRFRVSADWLLGID